jgi:glycosyltransferase involved in cell wall biosynthesis
MKPDVSIVLTTYNRAGFLPKTLDCLLNQSYPDFELWICDDGSSDHTGDVGRAYERKDSRVHYIRNEKNLRMPGNLNGGIRRCQGDLIAVVHDGDTFDSRLIEKWRAALLQNPSAGFVFNRYRHLAPGGASGVVTDIHPSFMTGKYFLETLCFADAEMECPVWGTAMVWRNVLEEMGLYDEQYSFWADMDMYFRIAEKYDVAFVPEVLIDLPSRKEMPHLFGSSSDPLTAHSIIFKMYWAARRRHYRGSLRASTTALGQQLRDFIFTKTRRVFLRLVRSDRPAMTVPQ